MALGFRAYCPVRPMQKVPASSGFIMDNHMHW